MDWKSHEQSSINITQFFNNTQRNDNVTNKTLCDSSFENISFDRFDFNMGIKDLWPILEPYCERKPLYELEGKIVAIDLAGWVCESMCVVDYAVQPRFYLR